MPFENREALRLGFEQVQNSVNQLAEQYTIQADKSFETWTLRHVLPKWYEERGFSIEWPADVNQAFSIGRLGNDGGLDVGMIVSKMYEGETIYRAVICQCYYPNDPHNPGENLGAKAAESITARNQLLQDNENEARRDFINELREKDIIISGGDEEMLVNDKCFLFFVTTAELPKNGAEYRALLGHREQGMFLLGGYELAQNEYLDMHPDTVPPPQQREIKLVATAGEKKNSTLVGLISVKDLHDFFIEDRESSPWTGEANQSLLSDNLRYKLASDKLAENIANGMKSTLSGEESEHFVKFNNGIVIVNQESEVTANGDIVDITLTRPSIVNGGQTTNSVYEAYSEGLATYETEKQTLEQELDNGEELPEETISELHNRLVPQGYVVVKIVDVNDDDELKLDIARFANKQNPISARDQHSTNLDQIGYYELLRAADNYIFWDYKRGKWERYSEEIRQQFNVTGKTFRILDNTKCMQNYLAMIGSPERAYKGSKNHWNNDKLVKFVFAEDRTQQRQIDTELTGLVNAGAATPIHCERDGRVVFAKDMILNKAIESLVKAISTKMKNKKKYSKETLGDSVEYSQWVEQTSFHSYWNFAVIHAFNIIINKHCEGLEEEAYAIRRDEIRNALLNGNFWQNRINTTPIFRPPATWTNWTNEVSTEDCNYQMLSTNDNDKKNICSQFRLLGFWLAGIESVALSVGLIHRKDQSSYKDRTFYDNFEIKLREVLNVPQRFSNLFPATLPVDDAELDSQIEEIWNRWTRIRYVNQEVANSQVQLMTELRDNNPDSAENINVYLAAMQGEQAQ